MLYERTVWAQIRIEGAQHMAWHALREGFCVWKEVGLPEERYRQATVRFPGGGYGDACRFLNTG